MIDRPWDTDLRHKPHVAGMEPASADCRNSMSSKPHYPFTAGPVMESIETHVLPAANFGPVELVDGFAAYLDRLADNDPDTSQGHRYRVAAAKVLDAMVVLRGPDCICANDFGKTRERENI